MDGGGHTVRIPGLRKVRMGAHVWTKLHVGYIGMARKDMDEEMMNSTQMNERCMNDTFHL